MVGCLISTLNTHHEYGEREAEGELAREDGVDGARGEDGAPWHRAAHLLQHTEWIR